MTTTTPRTELNEQDFKAQINLQKIWKAYKKANKTNQTDFAEDKLKWTQGNFSQYLTGQVRIGDKALAKLCQALDVNPWDIREEFKDIESESQLSAYKSAFELIENTILNSENIPEEIKAAYDKAIIVLSSSDQENETEESIAA